MDPKKITAALAKATKAALPAAIKDAARWKAAEMVNDAACAADDDGDSGEYPALTPAQVGTASPPARPTITAGQAAAMAQRKR